MKKKYNWRILVFVFLSFIFSNYSLSEVFIVAKVNKNIITNVDIKNEEKYLIALNPNIKKLSENQITQYAKDSLINEIVKKIEIERYYEIRPNENLLDKIIKDIYLSIGISDKAEFKNYLQNNDVTLEKVKNKIAIEIAWNDLIVNKFKNQISINQERLKQELEEKSSITEMESVLLSEIIFTVNDKSELEKKFNEIKESISNIGFNETARLYSLSSSKKNGGNLGWIFKDQLSKNFKDQINDLNIGEYTNPMNAGGGFMILKLNDIKIETQEINKEEQLQKRIEFEREIQLTRFSTLHYKRVFNNTEINEK